MSRVRNADVSVLRFRAAYVASPGWFEDVFGRHIDATAATSPSDVAEAARERGRASDLNATVAELLEELGG